MFKNVAASFIVFAFDATTNVPKTGDAANITAYVSKDYGAVTVLADTSATEMDATNAPGYYLFAAAQGETNANCLLVSGKSATANVKVIGAPAVIYTRPETGWLAPATAGRTLVVDAAGLADANVVKVGPTGSGTAQTAGDIMADTNDIQARLPAALVGGRMDANMGAISSDSVAADNAESFFDGTGYAGTGNVIPTVTTLTNLPAITAGWLTAAGIDADAITAAKIATGAIDADALAADAVTEIWAGSTAPTATQNADALLNRDMSAVSDTNARSPLNALRFLRNKWDVAATTLTVKKEDDSTTAWTGVVTAAPGADPISGNDPT